MAWYWPFLMVLPVMIVLIVQNQRSGQQRRPSVVAVVAGLALVALVTAAGLWMSYRA